MNTKLGVVWAIIIILLIPAMGIAFWKCGERMALGADTFPYAAYWEDRMSEPDKECLIDGLYLAPWGVEGPSITFHCVSLDIYRTLSKKPPSGYTPPWFGSMEKHCRNKYGVGVGKYKMGTVYFWCGEPLKPGKKA